MELETEIDAVTIVLRQTKGHFFPTDEKFRHLDIYIDNVDRPIMRVADISLPAESEKNETKNRIKVTSIINDVIDCFYFGKDKQSVIQHLNSSYKKEGYNNHD